jgi:hypothetical protein
MLTILDRERVAGSIQIRWLGNHEELVFRLRAPLYNSSGTKDYYLHRKHYLENLRTQLIQNLRGAGYKVKSLSGSRHGNISMRRKRK